MHKFIRLVFIILYRINVNKGAEFIMPWLNLGYPIFLNLPVILIAGITVNAVAGFGEELGWRGFLQKELAYMGFWRSSLLIGLIWGIWHAPIILMGHNYPEHPIAGVFMMTLLGTLLGPIFSYVRVKAKSVIAAAVIHGLFNASAGIAIMLIVGGNDLTVGIMGFAGIIVMGIVDVLILIFDRDVSKEVNTSTIVSGY